MNNFYNLTFVFLDRFQWYTHLYNIELLLKMFRTCLTCHAGFTYINNLEADTQTYMYVADKSNFKKPVTGLKCSNCNVISQ